MVVIGGIAAWQIYRLVPEWVENKVSTTLLEEGIIVTDFPVEHMGFRQTRVGKGALVAGRHSIEWDSALVGYRFEDLTEGLLTEVQVNQPGVYLRYLPSPVGLEEVPLEEGTGVQAKPIAPSNLEQPDVIVEKDPVRVDPPAVPALPEREQKSLWEVIQGIPLSKFYARGGVLDIQLQEEDFFRGALKADMEKQPFGISGEIVVRSDDVDAHVSVRVPAANPVIILQGEAAGPPGGVEKYGNSLMEILSGGQEHPRIINSGQLVMDVFSEVAEDGTIKGSSETSIDELKVRGLGIGRAITFDDVLVATVYKGGLLNVEAGTEVVLPPLGMLRTTPFGLRASLKESTRMEVETEAFEWEFGSLSGRGALRGQALLDESFSGANQGRLEAAISGLDYKAVHADAFSILLESDNRMVEVKASPLGLHRAGSIWIEELAGEWDTVARAGQVRFDWYGLVGQLMGSVAAEAKLSNEGQPSITYTLNDPENKPVLSGAFSKSVKGADIHAEGRLPLPWLDTLGKWLEVLPFTLGGIDPIIQMDLKGAFPLYEGSGRLTLDGVDLSLPEGAIKGIRSDMDFLVNILPRTAGWQTTSIDSFSRGPFRMADVQIEWELPSIRHLVVRKLEGRIGEGSVALEPFVVDPLKPVLNSAIQIRHLDADLLRRWLGEERFSMEGTISGSLSIGWENGELILGEGVFELDETISTGQFTFTDESFLREKFASFGGVPVELRDRLLDALLQKGIRIDSLEISLGPSDQEGVLLFKIAISGESKSEMLEVPIKGFVINNLISLEDLSHLLGMVAPVRVESTPEN
jgi:hypothetical protein